MSIQSKHFLNHPNSLVLDSLQGLCAVNPQLVLDLQNKSIFVAERDRSKVALICGGGSGHEPAHAGFVGRGMLTGAICGNIFASPSAQQVKRGIEYVDNEQGTLIIVKNYTGDVLNFGLAKEQYAATHPKKAEKVKFLIVGDDVAVGRTQGSIVGRRGLAGTILVYKIAGAHADLGASLDQVYDIASWVASNVVTIGAGLEHCNVPGTTSVESYLGSNEIEIGMGIHNESGYRRESPIPTLGELLPQLVDLLTSQDDEERSFLEFSRGKSSVVMLINNLGGTSEIEMNAIIMEARKVLTEKGFEIKRILAGTFMTSLNMPGFSITLLRLPMEIPPNEGITPSSDLILSLLDAQPAVPGWHWSAASPPASAEHQLIVPTVQAVETAHEPYIPLCIASADFLIRVERACNALISAEPEITRLDSITGDGDCGLTLKEGAKGVLRELANEKLSDNDVAGTIITIAKVAEEVMGGTSGALYSIFFSALAQGLQQVVLEEHGNYIVTPPIWAKSLTFALHRLFDYTRARPPSRTLIDPLAAFIGNLSDSESDINFKRAIQKAQIAAEETKNLAAKAGRSAYLEGDRLRKLQIPDPGAWGVKVILEALAGM